MAEGILTADRAVAAPRKQDSTPLKEVAKIGDLFTNAEFVRRIERAVPSIVTPGMMLSSLAGSLRKSPALAECSVADVAGKSLMLAQVGLMPDTALQSAHLIPFKERFHSKETNRWESRTVCQVVIGYHGLLDLAYRSGKVAALIGRVAWRDEIDARMFEFEYGTNEHLRHIPSSASHDLSPQAQASGTAELPAYAYAQATLADGKIRPFEVMPIAKVLAIRDGTPAYSFAKHMLDEARSAGKPAPPAYTKAPWVAYLEKMGAKTAARQLMNWLPRSIEYATMAALDTAQEHRSLDLGPIIDSTDYVSAAADAAEMSGDPGAAFGVRNEQSHSNSDAPVEGGKLRSTRQRSAPPKPSSEPPPDPPPADPDDRWQAASDKPATARAPTEAAPPPPAEQALAASVGGTWLERWLLDENDEPVGEAPITSPLDYARALEELWAKSSRQERLLEQNRDGMEMAAAADNRAAEIIASLEAPTDITIPIPMDRGTQNLGAYLREFKAAVATLNANGYLDFVGANIETVRGVALSTRSLLVKALVEQAEKLGLPSPAGLHDIMAPPAGAQPAQPKQAPPESTPQDEKDRRHANNILAEIARCTTTDQVLVYMRNSAVTAPVARWKADGKEPLVDEIRKAFDERYFALGGKPPAAPKGTAP